MGGPSLLGFGRQPFGHPRGGSPFRVSGPQPFLMNAGFGVGDWAEEVTWRILPEWMRDEDGTEGDVEEPLRGWIDSVKPLLNELIAKWRIFPSLWDANVCPIDQLPALAYTIGITLDSTRNELLQRAEVLNAPQLFLHKGTDKGYTILAAFEDQLVEIIPLWSDGCGALAPLSPTAPTTFEPHFDDVPGDEIPLDSVYNDQFAIWPRTLYYKDGQCRSHSLRLVLYPQTNPQQDFDPDVAGRIAERILRYKPIHVVIDRVTFDGLRGASPAWIRPVVAEASAAGMWVGPVTAELRAASPTWIAPVVGTPTP